MITGMCGGLARLVAARLEADYQVIGVDPRPRSPHIPPQLAFVRADYAKSRMLDVFRQHELEGVIHIGRRGVTSENAYVRFDQNVIGTAKILEACARHGVRKVVVLSSFHVYGAHPFNPTPITEDQPLRASQSIPELADAVQLDNTASTWMWQNRDVRTAILRPVNILGPSLSNAMCRFFRSPVLPYLAGFDPMMQFIHEEDMAQAIEQAYRHDLRGIFNVAGGSTVPFTLALALLGGLRVPVPHLFAFPLVGALASLHVTFPAHLMDFFRYPCVLSDEAFRAATRYAPTRDTSTTLRSVRR